MQIFTQTFGLAQTQSYLLIEGKEAIWIDPAPSSAQWIDRILPQDVSPKAILLTHSHWDHISDIGRSSRFLNAPIYVHPADVANIENPGSDGLDWPWGVPYPEKKNSTLHFLKENDIFHFGSLFFKIMHVPGHSPGCLIFLCESLKCAFSGDLLFSNGWGRVDLSHSSPASMKVSLKKAALLSKEIQFFPGHGASFRLGELDWFLKRFGDIA